MLKTDKTILFYDIEIAELVPINSIWINDRFLNPDKLKVKRLAISNTKERPAPVMAILYSKKLKCLFTMNTKDLIAEYKRIK